MEELKKNFIRLALSVSILMLIGLAGSNAALAQGWNNNNNYGQTIYALTPANELLSLSRHSTTNISSRRAITGLRTGENLLGIDVRPVNGWLYAVGSSNQIYIIDTGRAAAVRVGAQFTPALSGTEFGFDFNPTVDRIRLVSNTGQNLRLHPDTGEVAVVDGNLAYAAGDPNAGTAPRVVGSAYSNNAAGATTTVLYAIDSGLDSLARQDPPNAGTLVTIGALMVNTTNVVGFDISSTRSRNGSSYNNTAYAALQPSGGTASSLYSINLTTGRATQIGIIGNGEAIKDIAIAAGGSSYGGGWDWEW